MSTTTKKAAKWQSKKIKEPGRKINRLGKRSVLGAKISFRISYSEVLRRAIRSLHSENLSEVDLDELVKYSNGDIQKVSPQLIKKLDREHRLGLFPQGQLNFSH